MSSITTDFDFRYPDSRNPSFGPLTKEFRHELKKDLAISTMLPCRISLYESDGHLELATVEPSYLIAAADRSDLAEVAQEVEKSLRSIMAQATGE